VLVVQVDVVYAQAGQRAVDRGVDILRRAVHPYRPQRVRVAEDAELRGQDDLVATSGDRCTDQSLVLARAVHLGGVEKGDAEVQGTVDGGDGLSTVGRAVGVAHAHTAQAQR
jgi:hypothetical protein